MINAHACHASIAYWAGNFVVRPYNSLVRPQQAFKQYLLQKHKGYDVTLPYSYLLQEFALVTVENRLALDLAALLYTMFTYFQCSSRLHTLIIPQ